METGELKSINISGSGTASGGTYDRISISGSGKVTGDAEANRVNVSGSAHFDGSLKASDLHISGSFNMAGDLDAAKCDCSGAGRICGNAKADSIHTSGSLKIDGDLKAKQANTSGLAAIGGDIEGECVRSSGILNIGGLLSADDVEIVLVGRSHIREIGGEKITITTGDPSWGSSFYCFGRSGQPGSLDIDSIEGDDVHIESTTAKVVRGQRVKIGPNCRVERVEYGETLQIDPTSEVKDTAFTGEGERPGIDCSPVPRADGQTMGHGNCRIQLGTWEVRNPVLKGLAVVLGLAIAAVAVAFAMLAAGVAVGLSLGGVILVLLILAGGIPLLIVGALVLQLVLVPFRAIAWLFRRRL